MKKLFKFITIACLFVFLLANLMAAFHAYKFTHYKKNVILKTKNPEDLTFQQKVDALIFGVSLPRPENTILPYQPFTTEIVNNQLECWKMLTPNSKGTVILFHGYGSTKSSMLGKAQEFNRMGYSTFLVDFHGSGGSKGSTTTIGFNESKDVKLCYDYIKKENPKSIILCGTSMGAAAIMKCVYDSKIKPDYLILECPFGSMLETVSNRFLGLGIPDFPMAHLLVFYGGLINNFWAFDHNPCEYAKLILIPTLVLSGGNDERVSVAEINSIYNNLAGEKQQIIYQNATHESYLNKYRNEWREDVICFLENS